MSLTESCLDEKWQALGRTASARARWTDPGRPAKKEKPEIALARRQTAAKVSALVVANAYIFQEQLAATDGRISSLRKLTRSTDIVGDTAKHWHWIWDNINYVPIFQLGERVLN